MALISRRRMVMNHHYVNRNNNHIGDSFSDHEQSRAGIPSVSIHLPELIELQLQTQHRLKDAINACRHRTRYFKSSKIRRKSPIEEDDLLLIDSEPLCPAGSTDFANPSTESLPKMSTDLRSLMKEINRQCQDKKSNLSTVQINAIVEYIINEEILSEYMQNQMKINTRSVHAKKSKQNPPKIIEILPYENTYSSFYYPDQSISIDKSMLDKIIRGVQAMAMALTNAKDVEDILNGTVMLTNQSGSPLTESSDHRMTDELLNTLQKRFMTRKQPQTSNIERVHLRLILNLILADSRLTGTTLICRSESLILSCMLRKIRRCIQSRVLCSYGDVITTINEADHQQIRLRTLTHMCLSSDEFIEILGEIYNTSSDTIEAMKFYLEAHDVLDMDTNLLHPSNLTANEIEDMTKYLLHEDAIRQLKKLIIDRSRHDDSNNQQRQFKLNLPTKLNEFYQPIRKLNAFMSEEQVMIAIRKPYLSQLTQRSKIKAITASDLRAITSQISLSKEDFDALIAEKTITSDIVCQFYTDFHEREDIDERLLKIEKKIHEYANAHSCITRVVLKMLIERSHGTQLNPFLDQFDQTPRSISIVDLFDDLLQSGLISTTELILSAKQDIIVKKSALFKHFQRISFIRKHDADLLAEISLVIREDLLIESLTQRARIMKQAYIDCILNNEERRDFVQKNRLPSSKRLSSVSIHQFIQSFNLDPKCGKIFYWMNLADENIVKSLIETKTFVNEYTLDGIYKNFLTRLHDTLESGIYYVSAEKLIHSDYLRRGKDDLCQLGCYLTYEQALILVDFADSQYEDQLSSLIIIQDIIPREQLNMADRDALSMIILPQQQVIECKTLLDSFHQRILSRQKRFERIINLQKLLLSPTLFDQFLGLIPDLGEEYFTHLELDYLEETKLIDIGVLALLLTLPTYDPGMHQHKHPWFQINDFQPIIDPSPNSLHNLEPMIEKYSIFLTTILVRILSDKERFSSVNEILLSNPNDYLSLEEVLKISLHEHILSHEDLLRIYQEIFPTSTHEKSPDRFSRTSDDSMEKESNLDDSTLELSSFLRNISLYNTDSIDRKKMEEKLFLAVFDCLLHFNHCTFINGQLQQLFDVFKPLSIYTAQRLIEKETSIVKLLLKTRQSQSGKLTSDDLNRYLQSYPIPCRFDILNELRRIKLISQSLTNDYTMNQCHELRTTSAENQSIFLFYMFIRLLREEGYIDELNLQKLLEQYQTKPNAEKLLRISKQILRDGFLTLEQILQSTRDFFLQDYFLEHPSSQHRMVIAEQILRNLLGQEEFSRAQFETSLSQNMHRRDVIPIHQLGLQIKSIKLTREKVQRKVDIVLSKKDDNPSFSSKQTTKFSRMTFGNSPPSEISTLESSPDLRSLRHQYLQARIARNQLHLLVEQGGWKNEIHLQFKRELDIIDSDNVLDLIRHITENISILLKENGSIGEKPLKKHFQQHRSLFLADVEFLLIRYGMVALEDLIDLLVVSKLARAEEIESYAKRIFCLNVNQYRTILQTQSDSLVRKNAIENHLEKRLCIPASDLSQLLNHVLKLDRLKRIIELMPTIKNYIRFHPINTFNAVKAFKLEFDFNHYDMKFLRDLKVLNESWYKQYLLSRTSETGPIVSEEVVDDDQDQQEFKFRSSSEDDFDPDAFNRLFQSPDTQSQMSEQRKQAYLEEIKKRKDQVDSPIPKASSEEDQLQFSLNLDELRKQKSMKTDGSRVIEQFFPNPTILQPPTLIPYFSDQQQRLFMQLEFAREEHIVENDQSTKQIEGDQRKDVRRQTLIYRDTVGEEEIVPMLDVDMDAKEGRKDILIQDNEEEKELDFEEPVEEVPSSQLIEQKPLEEIPSKPLTERRSSKEIQEHSIATEDLPETDPSPSPPKEQSPAKRKLSIINDDQIGANPAESELRKPSIKIAASPSSIIDQEILPSKSASVTQPTTTTDLVESFKHTIDIERSSVKQDLKYIRPNIDQWLEQTLQHNIDIKAICIQSDDQSLVQKKLLINQLITYLHHEFKIIDENLISFMRNKSHQNPDWINRFQQRIDQIENILQEKKNHQEIIEQVQHQIHETDQIIKDLEDHPQKEEILQKYQQYQEDFRRICERECSEVQPLFGTRLELAIRTLDADLQLMEDILDGKSFIDLMPNTSRVTRRITPQPTSSIESEIHDHLILIQTHLSKLVTQIQIPPTTATTEQKKPHDLLRRDINDRLQAIKDEYAKQKLNEERMQDIKTHMATLNKLDSHQIDLTNRLQAIHQLLRTQSSQIQNHLSNITAARSQSDHPNVSLNVKLKYLPTDPSGTIIESPFYLVDEQNIPISDQLRMIRAPVSSDRFAISIDQSELTIVDQNQRPLSDPITFRQVSSILIQFEFIDNDQQRVQMVEPPAHQPIILNVKPIPSEHISTNQTLFMVDENDHPLSQPIPLIVPTSSELKLATFLYDEKTNEKILLTPEQYLIAGQQAEWTSRKFLTYIIDKDQIPISEPISISDLGIQLRHSPENVIGNKLQFLDNKRQQFMDRLTMLDDKTELLENISSQYKLINSYIEDRLYKLQIEEKIIEKIVPLLDNHHDEISDEQFEYKQEQSNMDRLLQTMKFIVQLDGQLTEYRKNTAANSSKIQQLEKQCIDQLIEISTELLDSKLQRQVQQLISRFEKAELLTKLRPIVLSGIKTRAKAIQVKCESLLISIYQKSRQLKQPEQIRSEYIQYLSQRFTEEIEKQKKTQIFYDKIERMQYDHYQKLADSIPTIELEVLDNQISDQSNLPPIIIPSSLKSKNEQLIYKFNSILRSLHETLTTTEEYEKDLLNELERFSFDPSNHDQSSRQQIALLRNEMQINQYQTLVNSIEKMKTLLNKLETIKEKNLQYYFLYSQLDRFYEILRNHYQIELPVETNIESIRSSLNIIRRRTRKRLDEYDQKRIDLQRKLDVLKKKEELKQRMKTTSTNEDGLLSSLNAYIQQSQMEPIGIRHQFYAMKIQQITSDYLSEFHHQKSEQQFSLLSKTLEHLSSYAEHLEKENLQLETKFQTLAEEISIAREYAMADSLVRERIEDLTKQQKIYTHQHDWISQMKKIVNETYHRLHALLPSDFIYDNSREFFKQLKHNAMETILQSAEYQRVSKRVSPQLLAVNHITSGQELIPAVLPSSKHVFQVPIETRMQQEIPSEIFLIENQSSVIYQQISALDLESRIRQMEIDYLQKQHAQAVAIGDLAQQLAAERAIASKIPREKQTTAMRQISDDTKIADQPGPSMVPSVIHEKPLVDQQIRGLVKKHMKSLKEQIRIDPLEPLDRRTIRSVEDLRRLNNKLKEFQQENDRPKQIEIQLQILDRVEQLDHQLTDRHTLENLRQQLNDEQQQQSFVVDSFSISSQQKLPMQILPTLPYVLRSSFIIGTGEMRAENVSEPMFTSVPAAASIPEDSTEKINVRSATITAEELYQELQQIRNSIEIAFEGSRTSFGDIDDPRQSITVKSRVSIEHFEDTIHLPDAIRLRSNSLEAPNSVLLAKETSLDPTFTSFSETRSPTSDHDRTPPELLLVGNARKYSIREMEANDQQVPTLTKRSIFHSTRDYGEVYVRHRLTSAADSAEIDAEREKAEKRLRDKIVRKTRLVKFDKTGQGNTVIHQPVALPTQTYRAPQQATYEENLQMAPPLIQLKNTNQSILEEFDESSWRSQELFTDDNDASQLSDQQNENVSVSLAFPSTGQLSPIEEEESEAMETTTGIAFTLTKQDSLTRKRSNQETDRGSIILTIDNSEPAEKQTIDQDVSSTLPPLIISLPPESAPMTSQPAIHEEQHMPSVSSPSTLQIESSVSRKSKSSEMRISKKKSTPPKDIPLIITTTPDDSYLTENLDIEPEIPTPVPIIPESTVTYYKVGLRSKSRKKKKNKKIDTRPKSTKFAPISEPAPMVLTPRKAVPFISATKDKQIDVQDDPPPKRKKKRRKRSAKSKRSPSTSRSPSPTRKKKKTKRRRKKKIRTDHQTMDDLSEAKPVTNNEAIAMHLLDVKRFTGPPVSPLNLDRKHDDATEISRRPRLKYLKPMIKNFDVDHHHPQHGKDIQTLDSCTLNKTLFDFQNDTKVIEQPAMFTEYIPDFFQKQAEEKQIRRISLTAIRTDEHLTKRLAARVPRLYNGYQPSDQPCAHTKEFRPLNKYLMSDISYYFEKDFIDHTGLFQHQKSFDKIPPSVKQPNQRFRDDYIVKAFFNCWRNYTTEKARLEELRRNRVNIDFREFWFQDAFSDPFYSYFEQPTDYRKKQHTQHQMAYRLHKRLVRTGREQPKETMNQINRSSYSAYLFNLPKNHLDRQGSLTRRRQSIDDDSIPLANLIAQDDDILPLIRERLHHYFPSMNISRYELAIKDLVLHSSILERGTLKDFDKILTDYRMSLADPSRRTRSNTFVKLPMIQRSSNRLLTNTQ